MIDAETMPEEIPVVHVHVDNAFDMQPVMPVQEVEATHATSAAFILPAAGPASSNVDANQNLPVCILQLDPLRKRAIISGVGAGTCFICTSQQQAQNLQFGPNQNADEAAIIQSPFLFEYDSIAPLWAVLASAAVTVGVLQERRNVA
jgi:hypothetical protein